MDGETIHNPSIVKIVQNILMMGNRVCGMEHVHGYDNVELDDLSRGERPDGDKYKYPPELTVRINCSDEFDLVGRLIGMCDPLMVVEGEEAVIRHWGKMKELARQLKEEGTGKKR